MVGCLSDPGSPLACSTESATPIHTDIFKHSLLYRIRSQLYRFTFNMNIYRIHPSNKMYIWNFHQGKKGKIKDVSQNHWPNTADGVWLQTSKIYNYWSGENSELKKANFYINSTFDLFEQNTVWRKKTFIVKSMWFQSAIIIENRTISSYINP